MNDKDITKKLREAKYELQLNRSIEKIKDDNVIYKEINLSDTEQLYTLKDDKRVVGKLLFLASDDNVYIPSSYTDIIKVHALSNLGVYNLDTDEDVTLEEYIK